MSKIVARREAVYGLYRYGDFVSIARKTGLSAPTVSRALRGEPFAGVCGLRQDGTAACNARTPSTSGVVLDVGIASDMSCVLSTGGDVQCEGGREDLLEL